MADGMGINFGGHQQPPIVTTQPDRILRHSISDEELDMLCEARSDLVLEILLIAIGAAIGALPQAISAMYRYAKPAESATALTFVDFVSVLVFWACIAVAVGVGIVFYRRTNHAESLRNKIRERTGSDQQE